MSQRRIQRARIQTKISTANWPSLTSKWQTQMCKFKFIRILSKTSSHISREVRAMAKAVWAQKGQEKSRMNMSSFTFPN